MHQRLGRKKNIYFFSSFNRFVFWQDENFFHFEVFCSVLKCEFLVQVNVSIFTFEFRFIAIASFNCFPSRRQSRKIFTYPFSNYIILSKAFPKTETKKNAQEPLNFFSVVKQFMSFGNSIGYDLNFFPFIHFSPLWDLRGDENGKKNIFL